MKIPASKVPAQVWADKMRTEGDLSEAESERLRRWDSSKQVYRVNSTLWDELKIDNKDEIPVSVFIHRTERFIYCAPPIRRPNQRRA